MQKTLPVLAFLCTATSQEWQPYHVTQGIWGPLESTTADVAPPEKQIRPSEKWACLIQTLGDTVAKHSETKCYNQTQRQSRYTLCVGMLAAVQSSSPGSRTGASSTAVLQPKLNRNRTRSNKIFEEKKYTYIKIDFVDAASL